MSIIFLYEIPRRSAPSPGSLHPSPRGLPPHTRATPLRSLFVPSCFLTACLRFFLSLTVRQGVDTPTYLFVRDGVFLQNAYWLLTCPDTDTTAARTCLTEGSSTAAVFLIKEVDGTS